MSIQELVKIIVSATLPDRIREVTLNTQKDSIQTFPSSSISIHTLFSFINQPSDSFILKHPDYVALFYPIQIESLSVHVSNFVGLCYSRGL